MRQFGRDLRQTFREWKEDDGNLLAAAMAYYTALSFLPVLLLLISGFGLFLRFSHLGQDAQQQILEAIAAYGSPALERQVAAALDQVGDHAPRNGPVGLIALLLAAISVFAQMEKAFDRIWETDDRERRGFVAAVREALVNRLRAFVMLLALGLLLVVVFIAGIVLAAIQKRSDEILPAAEPLWNLAQIAASLAVNAAAFTLLYRLLPKNQCSLARRAAGRVARGGYVGDRPADPGGVRDRQ